MIPNELAALKSITLALVAGLRDFNGVHRADD